MPNLRLIIYQPQAHYRVPFTYQRRHTYPIPPYSTIIGFICNACGIDDQNDGLYKTLRGSKISIAGRFENKITEMIWFRNLRKEAHKNTFGDINIREKNGNICHPGCQSPTRIDVLENVELIIHIYHEEKEKLEAIKKRLYEKPEHRLQPLHIGRAEDWIVYKEIKLIEDSQLDFEKHDGLYPCFFWIPEKMFMPAQQDQFDWNNFDGNPYILTTFSHIEGYENHRNHTGNRIYERIRARLNDGKIINTRCLFDKELKIPVFFADFSTNGGINGR